MNAPSTGSLVTSAGTWTFGAGDAILLNGNQAAGGYGVTMLVYNQGKLYVASNVGNWYLWNGSGWTAVSGDPRISISPDGSILNAPSIGSLVTSAGTWTFASVAVNGNYAILLNGKQAAGGSAVTMLVYNLGKLYVASLAGNWYVWNGSSWSYASGDPRGGQTKTITASAGTNGSITPSGSVSVNYGANQTFTVTPAAGYNIYQLLVDGSPQISQPGTVNSYVYTFIDVTSAHTISASFISTQQTETITASAGANGSISPSGQ